VNVNFISILFACLNQVADSGNAALRLPLRIIMPKGNIRVRCRNSITLGERRENDMIDSMCIYHPQNGKLLSCHLSVRNDQYRHMFLQSYNAAQTN
jgi:hypothetical protein